MSLNLVAKGSLSSSIPRVGGRRVTSSSLSPSRVLTASCRSFSSSSRSFSFSSSRSQPACRSLLSSSFSSPLSLPASALPLQLTPPSTSSLRYLSSSSSSPASFAPADSEIVKLLEHKIATLGEKKVKKMKELKKDCGDLSMGPFSVNAILGGMRGVTGLLTETSSLDAEQGITFRGYSIKQLRELLPCAEGGFEPLPEGLLWLLMTGEMPSKEIVNMVSDELNRRADIPPHVWRVIDSLDPAITHPMTQLVIGINALQTESVFARSYRDGMKRTEYWRKTLQDSLSLVAKVPVLAAKIFCRRASGGNDFLERRRNDLDWAANFANLIGLDSSEHHDFMRLYLLLHADHEGGNVSSHTSHVVGSALSDPYLSFAAGMAGLAGPLHGLANQECLKWLLEAKEKLDGQEPTPERIAILAKQTLSEGRVIPGYGHAVLRVTDPRLVDVCHRTIPEILTATGKVKNPYPNVDCHSGVLLQFYGLKDPDFYTVLFGISRAIGVASQLVWSRVLGLPIERPKSITIDLLSRRCDEVKRGVKQA